MGLGNLAQKCSKINQQYGFWNNNDPSLFAFLGVKWCTIVAFVILPKTFLQKLFLKLWAKMYLANQFAGFFYFYNVENYLKTHVFHD